MFRHRAAARGQNGNEAIVVKFIAILRQLTGQLDEIDDHLKNFVPDTSFVQHFSSIKNFLM